jgi:hypothetical protein
MDVLALHLSRVCVVQNEENELCRKLNPVPVPVSGLIARIIFKKKSRTPSNYQFFKNLPASLFYELREFINSLDYYRLLTTSKELHPVLHETRIVKLVDPTKQELELVLSKVTHPARQLCLVFARRYDFHNYVRTFGDQPALRLVFYTELTPRIIDWHPIAEHYEIVAGQSNNVHKSFENNFSKNLKKLKIYHLSKLQVVDSFAHLQSLMLTNCSNLSNVHCLENLSSLTLNRCPGVTDVSKLGRIHDLTLQACPGIIDISCLTNNKRLTITACQSIDKMTICFQKNVRYLTTDLIVSSVETRELENCRCLSLHFSSLRAQSFHLTEFPSRVFEVTFAHFLHLLPDLSALYSIPKVDLRNINSLKSLNGLGGNRMVSIYYCMELTDFSAVKNVPHVVIEGNNSLINGEDLCNVFDLRLISLGSFCDTSALKNVTHLSLENCSMLKELAGLEDVFTVKIRDCFFLDSLKGLRRNEKIILEKNVYNTLEALNGRDLGLRNYDHYDFEVVKRSLLCLEVVLLRKEFFKCTIQESINEPDRRKKTNKKIKNNKK